MKRCEDCKFNNTEECDIMACDVFDDINQQLVDCKAEINGINKILNYCSNWTDRLELEMQDTDDIWRRGFDVIGEEYAIIDEMVNYCNKRIDELKDELNDIRGKLSRYNQNDYDITCKYYEWLHDPFDQSEVPPVHTSLCNVCKYKDCPHNPLK